VMRPIERVAACLRFETIDYVPVCLNTTGMFYAGFVGEKEIEYYRDPEKMLKWQTAFQKRFPAVEHFLGIAPEYGCAVEPTALGCKHQWLEESSPAIVEPAIKATEDIDKLEIPDPLSDGLMPMALKAYKYFDEHLEDEFRENYGYLEGWSMNILGPFDLAALTRGITNFMADLYRNPEAAERLLRMCTKTQIVWLHAQEDIVGKLKKITISDDLSGAISKKFFDRFALPYFLEIRKEFHEAQIWLHNDSNTTAVLENIARIGVNAFHFGPDVDPGVAKRNIGSRVCLVGNIPPLEVFKNGTPDEVEQACKSCIDKASRGGGYMLSAGGAVARDTPLENIATMVRTAETYGRYK